jgi:hypothetical protein
VYRKYFEISNETIEKLMVEKESDAETANYILSSLLVENTDLKMFLMSTGKFQEYQSWIKRFKNKYNGIETFIKNNLVLEEVSTDKEDE